MEGITNEGNDWDRNAVNGPLCSVSIVEVVQALIAASGDVGI